MYSTEKRIKLSGDWSMDYLGNKIYDTEEVPEFTGYAISSCVPGYWEDLVDEFRKTALHTKLSWNPLYTLQRYPQAGYVPDMALPTVIGCFGYSRTFYLNEIPEGDARLSIGGAHNTLSAWINGAFIGTHKGYSEEFDIKFDRNLLKVGENSIILAVSNLRQEGYMGRPVSGCTSRAANECTGGIYGDVEIVFSTAGITSIRTGTAADLSHFEVICDAPVPEDTCVEIIDGNMVVALGLIEAGKRTCSISTSGFTLWSPDNPKLYLARVIVRGTEYSVPFGIRRLTVNGTKLYLNGEPFMFRAICEHGYYPLTVHPPRDKNYFRAVIRRLKQLGFNAIRFHTWVPIREYMEAADELGILIEVETPNNTTYAEWREIVNITSHFTSVIMYSSGNEMVIDEDYIEHLRACAELVHKNTDSLFSPMSAMRGIEYHSWGDCKVEEPFPHNPKRLAAIGEFCDVYNSYSRGGTSYRSDGGDAEYLTVCNAIYGKPLLSHEICINGTYIDLSLEERYSGYRIGDTELFSSVRRHLTEKGLIDRAPLYYKNSSEWQRRMRKHCFELCRRVPSFAGYDYLGDIDHHWHTFGYCVGMMNEFYELKPGESVQNVLRYNSDTVLLADLPVYVNFEAGESVEIPILASHFAKTLERATLSIRISDGKKVYYRRQISVSDIRSGELTELYRAKLSMPRCEKPLSLKLFVSLSGGDTDAENEWELYVFPKRKTAQPSKRIADAAGLVIADEMTTDELLAAVKGGKRILLTSPSPFVGLKNAFQISIAGRTEGHLATVIADTPLMKDFPHEGFCSWQFRSMMRESKSVALDVPGIPFEPIIEIASSYKNARKEALIAEYAIGDARLLICTLNLDERDAGARWLRSRIFEYVLSDEFAPKHRISLGDLIALCEAAPIESGENSNAAQNMNDITMRVK